MAMKKKSTVIKKRRMRDKCQKCSHSHKKILELEMQLKQALEKAELDDLTGLLNKIPFRESASHVFALCLRDKTPVTMLYIDLNDFKKINDMYGHPAGDKVLKEVASLLSKQFRESDILGRDGGDEFIALLPETNLGHAQYVAKKIEKAFSKYQFHIGSKKLSLSASIGIVEISPRMTNLEQLIEETDIEMYRIKRKNSLKK